MSWFDICKKTIKKLSFPEMSYSDLNDMIDTTDFSHEEAHGSTTPDTQWRHKVAERDRKARYLEKPSKPKEDEGECPPGTLWCKEHEECENEKFWHTHNSLPTKDDLQWGSKSGNRGPTQQSAQQQKTRGEG
jgi:hypothetical protein